MADSDLLVFVHIPKCAGTALNTWLGLSHTYGNLYVKASNVPITALRWTDVPPKDLGDVRMRSVGSHHLRTYPATIGGRTPRYVTILREPILRWISYVRFFRLLEREPPQPPMHLRDFAEQMLELPAHETLELVNAQANFIAAHEWFRLQREDVNIINWAAEPELFERYQRERLSFARDVLRSFEAVGTVEQLTEFTRVLQARARAWDVPLIPIDGLEPTLVTVAPPVDPTWINYNDSVGRRLLEAFAEDFELYRLARERLEADLRSLTVRDER